MRRRGEVGAKGRSGPCSRVEQEAGRCPPACDLGLLEDPLPERLDFGPAPRGRGGDETAAFGGLGLAVEDRDQSSSFELAGDQHRAADGGAEPGWFVLNEASLGSSHFSATASTETMRTRRGVWCWRSETPWTSARIRCTSFR